MRKRSRQNIVKRIEFTPDAINSLRGAQQHIAAQNGGRFPRLSQVVNALVMYAWDAAKREEGNRLWMPPE